MSHAVDEDQFRGANRARRGPPTADIAHTIREAVNNESGNIQAS